MKNLILLLLFTLLSFAAFSQGNIISAKEIIIKDSVRIAGQWVSGVTTDTSFWNDSNSKIATTKATRDYVAKELGALSLGSDNISFSVVGDSLAITDGASTLKVALNDISSPILDSLISLSGASSLAETFGTSFTGTTIPDYSNTQEALQAIETAHEGLGATVVTIFGIEGNLVTLTGVASNSTTLGQFAGGTTIPDSSDIKEALAALEIALEASSGSSSANADSIAAHRVELDAIVDSLAAHRTDIDNIQELSGMPDGSVNFGTFTGATIPDNSDGKEAFQALETAVEGIVTDDRIASRATKYELFDELHVASTSPSTATIYGDYGAWSGAANTGGTVSHHTQNQLNFYDHPVTHEFATGTTSNSTGYAGTRGFGYRFIFPSSTSADHDWDIEFVVEYGANCFGNTAIGSSSFVGLATNVPNSFYTSNNIVGFFHNSAVDDYFSIIADSAASETTTKLTSVAVGTNSTWYKFKLSFDSDTRSVTYYINDVSVGSTAVNLPASSVSLYPCLLIAKNTTTTTSSTFYQDNFYIFRQISR